MQENHGQSDFPRRHRTAFIRFGKGHRRIDEEQRKHSETLRLPLDPKTVERALSKDGETMTLIRFLFWIGIIEQVSGYEEKERNMKIVKKVIQHFRWMRVAIDY